MEVERTKRKREGESDDENDLHSVQKYEDFDPEIRKIVDEAPLIESVDSSTLRKIVLNLEKKINFNQMQRIKYADTPEKFMESEVDLDEEIKKMHILTTAPEFFHEFIALNVVPSLLSLLNHENIDISIDVIDLFHELTDIEIISTPEGEELKALAENFLENTGLELIIQNINRLDEKVEEERHAIHNTLGIVENLIEINPKVSDIIVSKTDIFDKLITIIQKPTFNENKLYASEILAILLSTSIMNQTEFGENRIEKILVILSLYKQKDPSNLEEEEMAENCFDCLCSSLQIEKNRNSFIQLEGIELMLIMIKKKKFARKSALKVLDYALLRNKEGCSHFVEQLGLKTLFAAFMKKVGKKKNKKGFDENKDEEHILSIILSLFRNLDQTTTSTRLMVKFLENDLEKVERLIELNLKYSNKVREYEQKQSKLQQYEDDEEIDEDEKYLNRLDAGLFTLQLVDLTLAYIYQHSPDDKIQQRVNQLLNQSNRSIDEITAILQEYLDAKDETSDDYNSKLEVEEKRIISKLLKN